ncbi:hypothetical protein SARC_13321 [Sphaeroforma arctica JP610]|uniref:Tubby C-terminal domain-containing protein n=1 Tax=Sphaeroforma arctica JP610 TaxID=667725 RepID=A0A0L0FBJ0_9EUKA|nr:hypothetical protein SARC_13321 [Sphaeroforma arctica JP610]KNC74122.1 hypothetical protein SARC_13321 [Sphaeroforma arctica JP610]|eukprot:XP_014148024.1 hypothetical protein SARC_13321 [Sphaeroforma arctica JP610]
MAHNPSAVIGQKFVVQGPEPQHLVFKENRISLTGDSGEVKDIFGQLWFKIKGKKLSLSEKKRVLDNEGNTIAMINEKLFSIHRRQYICRADETKVAEVKAKSFFQFKSNAEVTFLKGAGVEDSDPDYKISGSYLNRNYDIVDISTGNVMATVRRDIVNMANFLFGSDTYAVSVMPGFDSAFVVCIVVTLDEIFSDRARDD